MGIVLQAYLPDASDALEEITEIARRRVAAGGSPVKVRLVKGANLAMEQVEAELRGWPQAPYPTKADVDAHYVRLLDRAIDPARTPAVRVGVASHHLFHVALAHVLAADRDVLDAVDVEMLQGMAPAQARAVRDTHGSVLLYTPVVARKDFDVAIAYLVRRLEENAAPQNFLHTLVGAGSPDGLAGQRERFVASVEQAATVSTDRRRVPRPEPRVPEPGFANLPDTDPAVAEHRAWAAELLAHAPTTPLPAEATTARRGRRRGRAGRRPRRRLGRHPAGGPRRRPAPGRGRARPGQGRAGPGDGPRGRQDRRRGGPRGHRGRGLRAVLRRARRGPRRRPRPARGLPVPRRDRGDPAVELPGRDPDRRRPSRRSPPGRR